MRKLSCYLAGASAEPNITVVEGYIKRLEQAGLVISFDWTKVVRAAGSGSPSNPDIRWQGAVQDLGGVERCDIFWLLHPHNSSTGAWVEFGHALAFKKVRGMMGVRKPIIVVSDASMKCIFADEHELLVDHRYVSTTGEDAHELAFRKVLSIAGVS